MSRWRGQTLAASVLLLFAAGAMRVHADSADTAPDTLVSEVLPLVEPVFGDAVSASLSDLAASDAEAAASSSSEEPMALAGDDVSEIQAAEVHRTDETAAVAGDELASKAAIVPVWHALEPPYSSATPLPASGVAMYYNPGVMETVLESRTKFQQIEPCPTCIGYVAMLRYGDLDRRIWLQLDEWRIEGPFHVIDAAATQHVGQLLAREWVVDVDHRTAQRWGMRMPYVTIWDDPPLELLLANSSLPLHWSATVAPAEPFAELPQSRDIYLQDNRTTVKQDLELRHRDTKSYVDLLADTPLELYVK